MLKEWLETFIIRWALKNFTVENLRLVLDRCVAYLKVRAAETGTPVDDWAIEILESIVADDSKLQIIYDWIDRLIHPCPDGVCRSAVVPTEEQYKDLTFAVLNAGDNTICKAIPIGAIESILRLIIPVLIEYWRKNK